jgi:hypothetical protein
MSEILTTLRAELDNLERRLPDLEIAVANAQLELRSYAEKRERIRDLLRLYEQRPVEQPVPRPKLVEIVASSAVTNAFSSASEMQKTALGVVAIAAASQMRIARERLDDNEQPTTKKALMVKIITDFLTLRGSAHRSDILAYLESKGVTFGSNPIATLAAFMSNHKEIFTSDGKGTFTMTQPAHILPPSSKNEGSAEAATPSPKLEAAYNPFGNN